MRALARLRESLFGELFATRRELALREKLNSTMRDLIAGLDDLAVNASIRPLRGSLNVAHMLTLQAEELERELRASDPKMADTLLQAIQSHKHLEHLIVGLITNQGHA